MHDENPVTPTDATPDDTPDTAPESAPESAPATEPAAPRRGRRGLWWTLGVLGVLVVLAVWGAFDARRTYTGLDEAAREVQAARDLALDGDAAAARGPAERAARAASAADAAAHRLPLTLAQALPVVGDDVSAVRSLARTVDDLAGVAMPGVLDAVETLEPESLVSPQGRVDVEAIARVAPGIVAADDAVQAARVRLAGLRGGDYDERVVDAVTRLQDAVDAVSGSTSGAASAAALLPAMLGADGPRDYLLLVQSNAELRATGGIPGAVLHLHAQAGLLTVVEQRGAGQINTADAAPVLALTPQEQEMFGDQLGVYIQDVTLTPHFPRAAELARAMWERATGTAVDGVLATDPVALGHLVERAGPVTTPDGTRITGENAAQLLLNEVYLRITDPAQQDAFFAGAAAAVFDGLFAGSPTSLLDGLAQSVDERRLLVWSAHDDEQARLAGTPLAGEVTGRDGESPVVGVYLNDGSGAKMSWYLDTTVAAAVERCEADGSRVVGVDLTLTNTGPAGGAGLPAYVVGEHLDTPGNVRTNYDLYAPAGGTLESVEIDGTPEEIFESTYLDLDVASWTTELAPGASTTIHATFTVPADLPGELRLSTTPTAHDVHPIVDAECPT